MICIQIAAQDKIVDHSRADLELDGSDPLLTIQKPRFRYR